MRETDWGIWVIALLVAMFLYALSQQPSEPDGGGMDDIKGMQTMAGSVQQVSPESYPSLVWL